MKSYHSLPPLLLFLIPILALPVQGQIWSENFNSYPDGTFNAPPKWTSNATDCDDPSINTPGESMWGVYAGQFTVNDIEGFPCCPAFGGGGNDNSWLSETIDLSGYCDISVSMEVFAIGNFECDSPGVPVFGCSGNTPPDNSHDQVLAEYSLDAGPFTQFGYVCGTNGTGLLMVSGLNGSTLQLRFYAACKSNGETYTIDNITVNGSPGGTPTFTPIGPLCESDPPVNLPTTSLEGITGSWDVGPTFNPAGLGNTTTTITFSPDPNFCAVDATMNITVEDEILPNPSPIGPLCETDPPVPLPTVVDGIAGNWSGPGVVNNEFNPSQSGGNANLTFTPNAGQCAQSALLPVTVNAPANPVLGTATVCDNDPLYDLTQLEDPLYPGGTWTGQNVSGNMFDPTGLLGAIQLIYTPVTNCTNAATTTINVNPAAVPSLTPATVCETGGLVDLTPQQDPLYPNGTWSGPGVNGTNFNPSGLPGDNTLTFTSSDACVAPATTIITVETPTVPTLGTVTLCSNDGIFDLTTLEDPLYPGGTWAGPGVVGTNEFDPNGLFGPIDITYIPSQDCVLSGMTTITVNQPGTPDLGEPTVCQSSGLFDLTTIQDPLFPNGTWTGQNVSGNNFDPAGLSGPITVIFTPNSSCAFPASTVINVEVAGSPDLGSATLCESSGLFDLTTLQDPNFPNGTWAGNGVSGTDFDPTGLMGDVPLTFTPTGSCSSPSATIITVNASGTPQLDTAALCETAGLFNLNNIADPNFPTGTWSGDGVTGNNFDPDGQSGNVPLVFTPAANCSSPGNTFITVNEPVQPDVQTDTICQNSGLFNLNVLVDTLYPTGTWSGPGVTDSLFNPANHTGAVQIIFAATNSCTIPDTIQMRVSTVPSFSNLDTSCDPNTQLFTVTFDINGGSSPYLIDGDTLAGSSYTSDPLPSGSFSFVLNDSLGCGPVTISGSANCSCATDAGNMDFTNTPVLLCSGSNIVVEHQGNEFLDADDELIFVLHTNAGSTLGTILATSSTTTITNPGGLVLGQTYYVSAVAGNGDGNGGVDLTDDCLSVSQGVAVSFYLPTIDMNPPATICENECFDFTGQLTGAAPFIVDYGVFGGGIFIQDTEFGVGNTFTFTVCPPVSGTIDIEIYGIIDANDCYNPTPANAMTSLVVSQNAESDLNPTLCPGESITVNGNTYDAGNPAGTEVIVGGSANGCDSTVNISLLFFPSDTTFINETFCPGGSIIVNGTIYDENNPDGMETLGNGSINGCDSIISVNLTYNDEVIEMLEPTLCPGSSITVNGEIYDTNNPSGSETFPNGSVLGCDSTVVIDLSFYPPSVTNLTPQLCLGSSITINGEIYDENNPSGTQVIMDATDNGCDSTININVIFTNGVTFDLNQTICPEEAITVNGTVYDIDNPTGSEVFPNGSVMGCDSTVNISLSFFQTASLLIDDQFCTGGSVTVNGTVYDENNPSGTEVILNGSVQGCDSTVVVALTFSNSVTETVNPTLCFGGSITVNGAEYDAANPNGTETIPGGSILGCDSVIIVDLSFYDENIFDLAQTLCFGENISVNGTIYDEANPSGTELLVAADIHGCDSTVIINLDFHPPNGGVFEPQLCTGGSVTVNGTIYDESNPTGVEIFANSDVNGCDSAVFVNVTFTDNVIFEIEETICQGDSITINGVVYNENNPTGSETIIGGSVLGCDSTTTISISFFPDAIGQINETLPPGDSLIVNGTVYNQSNPSGTEILIGGSVNGCDSIININLLFSGGNIAVDFEANSTSCELGNDGSIVINSIAGGQPPYTIALNGSNSDVVAIFPYTFDNLENGFYSLSVVDANGTFLSLEIFLPYPDPPVFDLGPDIYIELGESTTLAATTDFTPSLYLWEPPDYLDCTDCEMPFLTPGEDITYFLTVTDENGCTFTDNVRVFVEKARNVYGPTAFSPNNDAKNDEFTLFTGQQVARINSLQIFDRWGALMFEQFNFEPNNLSIGWDGRHKGQMMNPGVYVWFAEVEFLDGQVGLYEGEVTLIR